ncbi:unnamed protein product [Rangifer tarandus platyrhynchus]|uniref:Uncharacterized protein n=1 Tax=Rangifer tarandus platyrhynchus TaxID=3082113 RepID=A0ABN8Y022_RANTA|nr:unnamed protein product [Rangifer tarandus platyrhynchus]
MAPVHHHPISPKSLVPPPGGIRRDGCELTSQFQARTLSHILSPLQGTEHSGKVMRNRSVTSSGGQEANQFELLGGGERGPKPPFSLCGTAGLHGGAGRRQGWVTLGLARAERSAGGTCEVHSCTHRGLLCHRAPEMLDSQSTGSGRGGQDLGTFLGTGNRRAPGEGH